MATEVDKFGWEMSIRSRAGAKTQDFQSSSSGDKSRLEPLLSQESDMGVHFLDSSLDCAHMPDFRGKRIRGISLKLVSRKKFH